MCTALLSRVYRLEREVLGLGFLHGCPDPAIIVACGAPEDSRIKTFKILPEDKTHGSCAVADLSGRAI
jgi:hypothetical protein